MANDFGTGKSIFVLAIVAGCFAILWPNVFYPMIQGTFTEKDPITTTQGCCDVMFDSDVNAIKVMTEICEKILAPHPDFSTKLIFAFQQGHLTKDIADRCQKAVLDRCGIDIRQFLLEKVRLGKNYKQMLDEIRTQNSSLCLKQAFGVSLGEIGLPRIIRVWGLDKPKHLRQERPPHLRPEFLHPALREKGRAIPLSATKSVRTEQRVGAAPMGGMRPPMGGPGQVVPAPRAAGGTIGILMPIYTFGIIIFFLYTMMRLVLRKTESQDGYENFRPEPLFQKAVFSCRDGPQSSPGSGQDIPEDSGKLVITAISGLVEEVNRQLNCTEHQHHSQEMKEEECGAGRSPGEEAESWEEGAGGVETLGSHKEIEEETPGGGVVKVVGMETTESCEGGSKWSRPQTPLSRPGTPLSRPGTPHSRPGTPLSRPGTPLSRPQTPPQNIFISGSFPSSSQLLVSDSHIETAPQQDNAVVLTGKVTLSLIGPTENNTNEKDDELDDFNLESNEKPFESNGIDPSVPLTKMEVPDEAEKVKDGQTED